MVHALRPYQASDLTALLQLYRNAVLSQCPPLYDAEQVRAWAQHSLQSDAVAGAIERGWTLVNPAGPGNDEPAAFAVLDPIDRLSLLYCDGRFSRQGRAAALVAAAEAHASGCGMGQLRTEASQLSRPLLLRRGWHIEAEETVLFAGVGFVRWRMIKDLRR